MLRPSTIISSLVLACMLSAAVASTAAADWLVNNAVITKTEAVETKGEVTVPFKISTASGVEVECASQSTEGAVIEKGDKGKVTVITFEKCKMTGVLATKCAVPETIATSELVVQLTFSMKEGVELDLALYSPAASAKEVFLVLEIKQKSGCSVVGKFSIKGTAAAELSTKRGECVSKLGQAFTATSGSKLSIGEEAVKLIGAIKLGLTSKSCWGWQ
jgi:hypothetical protein